MNKKNILCYSQYDFERIMKKNNWIDKLPNNIGVISICYPNEDHWFKNDCHNSDNKNIFNLDIDDTYPYWFGEHESECYDKALELFNNNKIKRSNAYFNYLEQDREFCDMYHVIDYEEANDLMKWIDNAIQEYDTIYIHCGAGKSRSQGVTRYIVDIYSGEYDIKLNPNNPNNTYNPHVLIMLKRMYNISR